MVEHITQVKEVSIKELEAIKEELVRERIRADKLEQENISLSKEYEKQCEMLVSQKVMIRELKKKRTPEPNLVTEIETLYKENNKLTKTNKLLIQQLKEAKDKEVLLAKALKENNPQTEIESNKLQTANVSHSTTLVKIKKDKVLIPKLDFSKLPQKKNE